MFSEAFWESVSRIIAEAFRMSISELSALRNNSTAKLIAAIPALAGCTDADRIAVQHVATYLLAESAQTIFDHRESDDTTLEARLTRISLFPDGERKVIRRGMNLLLLTMLCGYEQSVVADRAKGVYNPIASGSWDSEKEKARLVREIRSFELPEMDEIFDVQKALEGKWND